MIRGAGTASGVGGVEGPAYPIADADMDGLRASRRASKRSTSAWRVRHLTRTKISTMSIVNLKIQTNIVHARGSLVGQPVPEGTVVG